MSMLMMEKNKRPFAALIVKRNYGSMDPPTRDSSQDAIDLAAHKLVQKAGIQVDDMYGFTSALKDFVKYVVGYEMGEQEEHSGGEEGEY